MNNTAIFTIVSKNYLSQARILIKSLKKFNKNIDLYILLVDKFDNYFDPEKEQAKIVLMEDLTNIPEKESFFFKYTILELNTAVKPYFIETLLEKDYKKVIYFDPDIKTYNSLIKIIDCLDNNSIVLTPHIDTPISDGKKPSDQDYLLAGSFNLGFIGVSNTNTTKIFIKWWKEKLYDNCTVDLEHGLFVDQKWIDMIPSLFEDVKIIHDIGYNVAYWNIHSRKINYSDNDAEIKVNDQSQLIFFHFSGFSVNNPDIISKHQNRYSLKERPDLKQLFYNYQKEIIENDYQEISKWPYYYDYFSNGAKISNFIRKYYLRLDEKRERFGKNPFDTSKKHSFYKFLNSNHKERIKNIFNIIWDLDKNVQKFYPTENEKEAFKVWLLTDGKNQYHIDSLFFEDLVSKEQLEKLEIINKKHVLLADRLKRILLNIFGEKICLKCQKYVQKIAKR